MDLISVILPTFDRAHVIGRQLDCLANQDIDRPFEVIVADNGSTDDTRAVVGAFADRLPGLRVVDASGRQGVAHARNVAVAAATGPLLAFCDSDDAAQPDWLRLIIAALEANAMAIVAGGIRFGYEGEPPPTPDQWGELSGRAVELDYLPFVDTASMAIRRADLDRIGPFDEDLLRCSDVDFSFRAQLLGLTLVDQPAAMMIKYQPAGPHIGWKKNYRWCTMHPVLYRRFRDLGMPRRSNAEAVASWAKVGVRILLSFNVRQRELLIRTSPESVGHLVGSIRQRVWYP